MSNKELHALAEKYACRILEEVPDACLQRDLVKGVPVDFLRNGPMLPILLEGERVLLTDDPTVEVRFPELAMLLGGEVEPVLAERAVVRQAIDRCFAQSLNESGDEDSEETESSEETGREDLLQQSEDAPVAARVSRLLLEAMEQGASDIHLEPRENGLQLRFRLDGVLYQQPDLPRGMEEAIVSRLKIMSRLDVSERRLPQDGNARVRVGEEELDIRVSTLPVADGERVVLRLLGRQQMRYSLEQLGMPEPVLQPFRRILSSPNGVLWVTGPTGSGKTTTLYAALQELDTRRRNVLTIEDPVEYQLQEIGQVGVQSRIGLTFAAGLRSLLRQDPDVILVGETRDEETAEIVVRASLTGHLVLSTLHANDALAASMRLTDMGVEAYLVAEATRGAMAQRLIRRLCPHCRESAPAQSLPRQLAHLEGRALYQAEGCDQCREGYRGRIGLYEFLELDDSLREGLRRSLPRNELEQIAQARGFRNLWQDAGDKLVAGETDLSEIGPLLGSGD